MEVYKTIKRSFSATANGIMNSSRQAGPVHNQLNNPGTGTHWIHPPDILVNGRVEYAVKMLGQIEVQEPKGTHIVRDAIHAIRFHLQIKRGETGHSGAKLKKVLLQISIYGVNIMDPKTRAILFKHSLHRISFCADDKQDKRVFSYIAKNDAGKHQCFVFLSDKMAENITLTIGEAFDLAYEKFIKKKGKQLEDQKAALLVRKRVAELEEENRNLKLRLVNCKCGFGGNLDILVPNAPVPSNPPEKLISHQQNGTKSSSSPAPAPPLPLAPPPRRASAQQNSIDLLSEIFEHESSSVCAAQPFNMNDFFDDEFDPRGINKTDAKEEEGQKKTVEDFEALLRRVDIQLAEVQNNLTGWSIERGDTGDSARDWPIESEELQKDEEEDKEVRPTGLS